MADSVGAGPSGRVKDTLDNLVLTIRNDESLHSIAFNLHRDGIDAGRGLPWKQIKPGWNDSDFASLKVYLNKGYGVYAPAKTKDALIAVASERAYHRLRNIWITFRAGMESSGLTHC